MFAFDQVFSSIHTVAGWQNSRATERPGQGSVFTFSLPTVRQD